MSRDVSDPPSCPPDCYGELFPDVSNLRFNKPNQAKVASITIESQCVGIQSRQLTIDRKQWEACPKCKSFEDCYKLSLAKLIMQQSLAAIS